MKKTKSALRKTVKAKRNSGTQLLRVEHAWRVMQNSDTPPYVAAGPGEFICQILGPDGARYPAEVEIAHAKLLAAAPENYSANQLSLRNVESMLRMLPVNADPTERESLEKWATVLRAGINKVGAATSVAVENTGIPDGLLSNDTKAAEIGAALAKALGLHKNEKGRYFVGGEYLDKTDAGLARTALRIIKDGVES